METSNIIDCINITGNAGHNIEHRRAKIELQKIEEINAELLEALKLALNLLEENQGEAKWYLRGHYNRISEAIKKATE